MKRSKGFTLIELLLTLGVIALLLVGVFVVYPQVATKIKVNRELVGYRTMAASIRTMYPRPPYRGLTATTLRTAGLVPDIFELPSNTASIRNLWGGTVQVTSWSSSDTSSTSGILQNRVRMLTTAVPQEACIQMAQGFFEFGERAYVAPTGQAPFQPNFLVYRNDPGLLAQLCAAENTNGFTIAVFFQP